MPTNKARLQVILPDTATERVKELATERGLSVSAMVSQLIHAALQLKEYQKPPDLSEVKAAAITSAIKGTDLNDFKLKALLDLVQQHVTNDSLS